METLSGLVFEKSLWLTSYEPNRAHGFLKNQLKHKPSMGLERFTPLLVSVHCISLVWKNPSQRKAGRSLVKAYSNVSK